MRRVKRIKVEDIANHLSKENWK